MDTTTLHARALEILATAPDQPTLKITLERSDFPADFHVGVWMSRHAAELGRAFVDALADRPAVRRVEVVCPEMFRMPIGFDVPPKN